MAIDIHTSIAQTEIIRGALVQRLNFSNCLILKLDNWEHYHVFTNRNETNSKTMRKQYANLDIFFKELRAPSDEKNLRVLDIFLRVVNLEKMNLLQRRFVDPGKR